MVIYCKNSIKSNKKSQQISPIKQSLINNSKFKEEKCTTLKNSPSEKHWKDADLEEEDEPVAYMPRGTIAAKKFGEQCLTSVNATKTAKNLNAMQTLTKLNALISKVKIERKMAKSGIKLNLKEDHWKKYDQKFENLMEELRIAYNQIKK